MKPRTFTRHVFLKASGAGLVSLTTSGAYFQPQIGPNSRVHLHTFDPTATSSSETVRAAMLAATDLSWLRAGDSVFVKVASNSNYASPAVTSPTVLEGVVSLLKEAGADTVFVGDMSGAQFVRHLSNETIGSTRDNMRQNGLLATAEASGATIHCFEEVPFEQAYVPAILQIAQHWSEDLQVAGIPDRVDHNVNLAWESLRGGRAAAIEVIPGGLPQAESLAAALTQNPALGIVLPH